MKKATISSVLLACLWGVLMCWPASAQQFTIKISSPTVNDATQLWMKIFKKGVESRSGGKIKVEMYPANQLGQIPATVEGVAMGTIEMTAPATGFFVRLDPRFMVFDAPGLFANDAQAQKVLSDPALMKRFASFGKAKGIEPVAVFPHGPLMVLSHTPIRKVADFRGLKIRVPGPTPINIDPLRKLGASPISMALGEAMPAMQNHTIDGLTGGVNIFTAFKYYDVAKALTRIPRQVIVVAVVANRRFLKSLGPDLEKIVREEAIKAQHESASFEIKDDERAFATWKQHGGEIIDLPKAESDKYLKQVTSVLPKILATNAQLREDYEALHRTSERLSK
jgi:TRAP-type C4-dicarboxylate transport system substrate-binding protein